MGICPKCLVSWQCKDDFMEHARLHNVDPWKVRQVLSEWELHTPENDAHTLDSPCKCPMYGARFECELKKHRVA